MRQPFKLISDVASLRGDDTRVAGVPANLGDRDALLAWYTGALGMPEYFGSNWDAFDECLRDLSWVSERRVVLYHRAVPLKGSPEDQKIYIDVLARAVRDWKPGETHELVVAFDLACELELRAATRAK